MGSEARAIRSVEYKQQRQFLSGYHMGYERVVVWRVEVKVGASRFLSDKTYASEESAKRAARRLNDVGH